MPSLADAIRAVVGGASGNVNDGLKAYYAANGGVGTNLNDLERSYLLARLGLPSSAASTNDLWMQFLAATPGSLNDKQLVFWAGGGSGGGTPEDIIRGIFTGGAVGAWYDPSDFSTMFDTVYAQNTITAATQSVGLILDKSKSLALGPDILVNGSLTGSATGWTLGGSWVYGGNALNGVVASSADYASASGSPTLTAGALYKVETISTLNSGSNFFQVYGGAYSRGITSPGTNYAYLINSSAVKMSLRGVFPTVSVVVDNVTVKLMDSRPAYNANTGQRPVLTLTAGSYWLNFDAIDDTLATIFPDLGTNVTIARAVQGVGTTILTGQTIGAGSWSYNTDHAGLIIVNRALTGPETTAVTAYLNAKAGV